MSRTALLFIALSTFTTVSVVACDEQDGNVSLRRPAPDPVLGNCPPPPPCECGDTTSTGADESTGTTS